MVLGFDSPEVREIRIIAKFEDYAKQGRLRGIQWLANVIKALKNPAARQVLKLAPDATDGDILAQLSKYKDIPWLLKKCGCDLPSALQAESHLRNLVQAPARSAWEKEAANPTGKLDHLMGSGFCEIYWLLILVGSLLWLTLAVFGVAWWMYFTDTHFEVFSGWKWWAYPHGFFAAGIMFVITVSAGILGKALQFPSCRDRCCRWCCCCCCRRRRVTMRSAGSSNTLARSKLDLGEQSPRSARSGFSEKHSSRSKTSWFSYWSRNEEEPELDEEAIRKEMNLPEGYDLSLIASPPDNLHTICVSTMTPENTQVGDMFTWAGTTRSSEQSQDMQIQRVPTLQSSASESQDGGEQFCLARGGVAAEMTFPHEIVLAQAAGRYSPRTTGYIAALEPYLRHYGYSMDDIATLVKRCHHDETELQVALGTIIKDAGELKSKEVSLRVAVEEYTRNAMLMPPTVVSACGVCGKDYPRGAKVCGDCGTQRLVPEEEPEYPHPHDYHQPIVISGSIAALWHDPSYSYAARFQHQAAKAAAEAAKDPSAVKVGPVTAAMMNDAKFHLKRVVVDQPFDGMVEEMRPHMTNFCMKTIQAPETKYPDWHPNSEKSRAEKDALEQASLSKKTTRMIKPLVEPQAPKPTSISAFMRTGMSGSPSPASTFRSTQPNSVSDQLASNVPERCVGLAHPSTFTEMERQHRFIAFSGRAGQNTWATNMEEQILTEVEEGEATNQNDDRSVSGSGSPQSPLTPQSPFPRKGSNDDSSLPQASPISVVSGTLRATANESSPIGSRGSRSPRLSPQNRQS